MRVLLLLALMLALVGQAAAAPRTAAVYPLAKGAGGAEFDGLGRALADMMVTDLSSSEALLLVERMQLGLVLEELKLAKSGFLDPKTAQKLGKGLGAELMITGSFSIIDERFVMDCRIIVVQSGSLLRSVRSEGTLDDFVAIEKDVVEKLLEGLAVQLSPGQRRKLLLEAPTESPQALASYGRGVQAADSGDREAAVKAFEEALRNDPDFAKASLELRDLAVDTEKARAAEAKRSQDGRERARQNIIRAIPPESSRGKSFVHSRVTLLDFVIRQELLGRTGQHCQRYAELKHYFMRTKGDFKPWFVGLKPTYEDSWYAAEAVMDARMVELAAPLGDKAPSSLQFETSSSLSSGKSLLLFNSMSPEKFHGTLLAVLAQCHPIAVQVAEFDALAKAVKSWPWIDQPLYKVVGSGDSKLTVRDSLDLYWAFLRAHKMGVDKRARARTDAVLARHPVGDPDRASLLSRIEDVVTAGEQYERGVSVRLGRSEKTLIELADDAIAGRSMHLENTMCKQLQQSSLRDITFKQERLRERGPGESLDRRAELVDQVALALAPLMVSSCFQEGKNKPSSVEAMQQLVTRGIKRPHPAALQQERCLEQTKQLAAALDAKTSTSPLLEALFSLRYQRCLLP